jgi:hypothetical protein
MPSSNGDVAAKTLVAAPCCGVLFRYAPADNISGLWWGVGVVGVAVLVSTLTLTERREP